LLVNAVRFTEHGEISLTIRITEPRQHVQIEVSDTGIGIAPEHQERVFEEFFQVRGPLQVRSRGTGLGLAHSRRLTEALGGQIAVRSELGVGSTFTVLLPVHWNAAMAGGSARVAPTVVSGRTALIVDDDEGFRTALRGMLQGPSQRVSEASGGEEALAMMAADRPDVVFLDLRMPDLGGAEVLARMGAAARGSKTWKPRASSCSTTVARSRVRTSMTSPSWSSASTAGSARPTIRPASSPATS
jgi:Histidine kinase-, DNA gyrase B-, and HSP90-like ATPase/Response regulator receiver domain